MFDPSFENEIRCLSALDRRELCDRWEALMGTAPPKGIAQCLLLHSIAYEMQAKRYGGIKPVVRNQLLQLVAPKSQKCSRKVPPLRPGNRLVREWNGKTYVLDVIDEGFEWEGARYGSLSVIARRGLKSKYRVFENGRCVGGKPISPGHIYKILSNVVYLGDVRHKQNIYPGEHEGIVDRKTWEAAQNQLLKNSVKRRCNRNVDASNILAGLLRDDSGRKMIVKQSNRRGRRYRYYVSDDVPGAQSGKWRLPAKTIEAVCIRGLGGFLDSGPLIIERLGYREKPPDRQQELLRAASRLAKRIANGGSAAQRKIILKTVDGIEVRRGSITLRIKRDGLLQLLCKDLQGGKIGERAGGGVSIFPYDISVSLKKRGVEKKFIITDDRNAPASFDAPLIAAVAKGHKWFAVLRSGKAESVTKLAARCGVERTEVGRILQLAFLAPDIVEAILAGRQPIELPATHLRRMGDLPISWEEQRRALGF